MAKIGKINFQQLKKLALKGFTDREIADFFGITETTLNNYKQKYKQLFESLKDWKSGADEKVEKSLYQRAIGYEYNEIKLEDIVVEGKILSAQKRTVTTKQVVPDVTAQIFWLKNRQPGKWKDTTNIEHSVPDNLIDKFKNTSISDLLTQANALIGKSTSKS